MNAPCVLRNASNWVSGLRGSSYVSPRAPEAWHARLNEVCTRPVSTSAYVPLVSLISPEQERHERQKLAERAAQAQKAGNLSFVDPGARHAEQFWNEELPRLRREEAERRLAHALQPISANPPYESKTEFLARAHTHWDAMEQKAKELGITAEVRQPPESNRDLKWLLKFQLEGLTYRQIAETAAIETEVATVRRAIARYARLLNLKLRRLPLGRPPRLKPDAKKSDN